MSPPVLTPTEVEVIPSVNFVSIVDPHNNYEIFCPGH